MPPKEKAWKPVPKKFSFGIGTYAGSLLNFIVPCWKDGRECGIIPPLELKEIRNE